MLGVRALPPFYRPYATQNWTEIHVFCYFVIRLRDYILNLLSEVCVIRSSGCDVVSSSWWQLRLSLIRKKGILTTLNELIFFSSKKLDQVNQQEHSSSSFHVVLVTIKT